MSLDDRVTRLRNLAILSTIEEAILAVLILYCVLEII
jgi:hypothetical protein